MYRKFSISVVLPCLNEENGISKVISGMPTFIDEVIVVDNNSVDRTGEVASKAGALVIKELKRGYGSALKAGIKKSKSDLIITMDGDGTYLPKQIPKLVDRLIEEDLDFLSGNRFNRQYKNSLPFVNLIGNIVLTVLTNILFGRKILDSQSGMMLFKKQIRPHLKMECDGMEFSEEVKINAILNKKIRFGEYPIPYSNKDRLGQRKLRLWRDGFRNLGYLFWKRFNT